MALNLGAQPMRIQHRSIGIGGDGETRGHGHTGLGHFTQRGTFPPYPRVVRAANFRKIERIKSGLGHAMPSHSTMTELGTRKVILR